MGWMPVVVVMRVYPVTTGLTFETLQACLDGEDRAGDEIADAFNRRRSRASSNPEQSGRPDSKTFMQNRIGLPNVATGMPHASVSRQGLQALGTSLKTQITKPANRFILRCYSHDPPGVTDPCPTP